MFAAVGAAGNRDAGERRQIPSSPPRPKSAKSTLNLRY
jgi:hypothetical protein